MACLTATAGEIGQTVDESRWPQHRLAEIRRSELRDSLRILGIEDHTELDLPDGGLAQIDRGRGTALVSAVIDRAQPRHHPHLRQRRHHRPPRSRDPSGTGLSKPLEPSAAISAEYSPSPNPAWLTTFAAVNKGILADEPPSTPAEQLALHVHLTDADLDRKIAALHAQPSQNQCTHRSPR